MTLYDDIAAKITGRIAIQRAEADCLEALLAKTGGLHVEIGCLWGGTAILAALAKRTGSVISIDVMDDDYWVTGDPEVKHKCVNLLDILGNFARFQVAHRISLVKASSHPWPLPADVKPTSVLIDGDHSYAGCLADWNEVRRLCPRYVLFHDYATGVHPGVQRVVDEVVKADPAWKLAKVAATLIVFERTA